MLHNGVLCVTPGVLRVRPGVSCVATSVLSVTTGGSFHVNSTKIVDICCTDLLAFNETLGKINTKPHILTF